MSKPSELAITLATAGAANVHGEGWVYADEVRGKLARLGFDCSTQQVAAWLAKMARTDAPWVDRMRAWDGCWQYRVTHYGSNDVDNKLGGVGIARAYPLRPIEEREAVA